MTTPIKSTAVFLRPFQLPTLNETLPAGEYEIETQLLEPLNRIEPDTWTSSVLVRLHPRTSHPGLSRTLTVPLAELEHAAARDKLTGRALKDHFLDEMLADPMIRLVMQADGVAETELCALYADGSDAGFGRSQTTRDTVGPCNKDGAGLQGPGIGSARPGIGE